MSSIGELLFNKLYILFISAALLLLIAMVGAIILTMDDEILNLKTSINKIEKNRFYSMNVN
jgi:hypothetical protein